MRYFLLLADVDRPPFEVEVPCTRSIAAAKLRGPADGYGLPPHST